MGRSVYLTETEISALRDTASEWCDIMGCGDDEANADVQERLNHGLGSALLKLHHNTNGAVVYRKYGRNSNA